VTYEGKMAELRKRAEQERRERRRKERMADPNDPYYSRKGMPTHAAVARYWSERGFFHRLDMDYPCCFACGSTTGDTWWSGARLERCHLIAEAEGGTRDVSNIVLLCKQCHEEAPMVGVSPQPMIDWINRRESYIGRFWRRALEEMRAIRPTLPEEAAALGMKSEELQRYMDVAAHSMRIDCHPGGDMYATMAVVVANIVDGLSQ
jgi:5-methylcytosine-specific restriction endonuclease McrA